MLLLKGLNGKNGSIMLAGIIDCLAKEDNLFNVWKINYRKNKVESNILLAHLGN